MNQNPFRTVYLAKKWQDRTRVGATETKDKNPTANVNHPGTAYVFNDENNAHQGEAASYYNGHSQIQAAQVQASNLIGATATFGIIGQNGNQVRGVVARIDEDNELWTLRDVIYLPSGIRVAEVVFRDAELEPQGYEYPQATSNAGATRSLQMDWNGAGGGINVTSQQLLYGQQSTPDHPTNNNSSLGPNVPFGSAWPAPTQSLYQQPDQPHVLLLRQNTTPAGWSSDQIPMFDPSIHRTFTLPTQQYWNNAQCP